MTEYTHIAFWLVYVGHNKPDQRVRKPEDTTKCNYLVCRQCISCLVSLEKSYVYICKLHIQPVSGFKYGEGIFATSHDSTPKKRKK